MKLPALFLSAVISLFVFNPAVVQGAGRSLILASSGEEGDNFAHDSFAKLMELIDQKSGGAFNIIYRPGMQLGDEPETVRLCQTGSIQMATLLSNNLAPFAPRISWLNMPYFFENRGDFQKTALKMIERTNEWVIPKAGVRIIALNEIGFRNLTTGQVPVRSLEDARRLKIRVPASPMNLAVYEALSLTPVALNFSEVFGGLAQGVVDGQESAYSLVTLKKFYEVQKYATDIQVGLHVGLVIASEKWFSQLPPDLQKAVTEAGREATIYEFSRADHYIEQDRRIMTEAGMKLLGPPDDFSRWRELGRESWPKAYKIIGGGDEAQGRAVMEEVKAVGGL